MKSISKIDISKDLKVLESNFRGAFNWNQLKSEFHLMPAIIKQSTLVNIRETYQTLKDMDKEKHPMIKNLWTMIQIVLKSGAT